MYFIIKKIMNKAIFLILSAFLLCISNVKSYTYNTVESQELQSLDANLAADSAYFDAARESLAHAGLEQQNDIFQKVLDNFEKDSANGKPLNERRRIIIIIIIIIRIEIRFRR